MSRATERHYPSARSIRTVGSAWYNSILDDIRFLLLIHDLQCRQRMAVSSTEKTSGLA
jgi:hypothetical protein